MADAQSLMSIDFRSNQEQIGDAFYRMRGEIDEFLEFERQEKAAQLLLNSAQATTTVNADANLNQIFDHVQGRMDSYSAQSDGVGSFLGGPRVGPINLADQDVVDEDGDDD